jgi:mRNA-degrading endonuclease toxin of MazEF toxin-antitoxin module
MRPCLVLADPAAVEPVRFSVVVAPLTSRVVGEGPLYVRLPTGTGGLPAASTVLLDQVSAIDAGRVRGYIGRIEGEPFRAIISGLRLLFGL